MQQEAKQRCGASQQLPGSASRPAAHRTVEDVAVLMAAAVWLHLPTACGAANDGSAKGFAQHGLALRPSIGVHQHGTHK
jgi:hypothetical protein